MNPVVNDKEILQKHNEILDKIKNLFGKIFDSESEYNDKYIKAKINLYNTNVYSNKTPMKGEQYPCFSVILLYFIANIDKKISSAYILKGMQICNKEEKDNECN